MKIVVVTGSTRGIGFGLADSFLAQGCAVAISGRTPEAIEVTCRQLARRHARERILGIPCDVTDFEQVRSLWDQVYQRFGRVDIWVNNAGIGCPQLSFWDHPADQIRDVVTTNLIGAMYGSKVALRGMLAQGFGSLYNMEGLGSDGRMVDGLTPYGSSKRGLGYLNKALAREVRGTAVLVGALRPGMVVTDLLTAQYGGRPEDWARAKRIFNILADRVETIAPWLVRRVLTNEKNGACFQWLPTHKVLWRFLSAFFRKRDLFLEAPGPR